MNRPQPYTLTQEELEKIIKDACISSIGYIKVTNYGGSYALIDLGVYTVFKQGYPVVIKKDRKVLCSIFSKLINRYLNFEHNGFSYSYCNGRWNRIKENTVR